MRHSAAGRRGHQPRRRFNTSSKELWRESAGQWATRALFADLETCSVIGKISLLPHKGEMLDDEAEMSNEITTTKVLT